MAWGPAPLGAPLNSFLWRLNINRKFAKVRRDITSQFTLKRAETQQFILDSYQYSNNTTILCIWARESCRPSVWKRLQKKKKKKKTERFIIDVEFPLTKSSQQRKTARHCKTPMKRDIVSIASYVCLFLPDFPQTVIACWNSISGVGNLSPDAGQ